MKKITLIIALIIVFIQGSLAQINLEHEFNWLSAASVNLPTLGYKYYAMDAINNKCIIYNTDYTLYKQINIPVPSGYYLIDLQYVSENIFNTDPQLEFLYVIYKFDSTLGYGMYSTRIMNEAGTQLLQVDGGGYSLVYPAAQGSKLFVWMYDFSLSLYSIGTRVYSLPGSYSTSNSNTVDIQSESMLPYPNPARDFVLLPIPKDFDVRNVTISLFDKEGKMVPIEPSSFNGNLVKFSTIHLKPGNYYYRINQNTTTVSSGKLLIAK
ncbi:MAG: hypothetical protein PWR20_1013 [Bacteroidales bacterium]|nr:hypothetical protein [Bacteroidales bacterium]MDN5328308.1 hypothetical protein [Bacteroidales bacterium]